MIYRENVFRSDYGHIHGDLLKLKTAKQLQGEYKSVMVRKVIPYQMLISRNTGTSNQSCYSYLSHKFLTITGIYAACNFRMLHKML